jgi:GNAT superfamily N-acetyltransferase
MIKSLNPDECKDQIAALVADNWSETGFDWDLKPNWMVYGKLYEMGYLISLAAFDQDEIVGYSVATVSPHLFNGDVKVCTSSALFVKPSHRNRLVSGRLIVETEREAKRRGSVRVIWQTRANTPLAELLRKRGYQDADVAMMKGI